MSSQPDAQISLTLGGTSHLLQETLLDEQTNSFILVGRVNRHRVTGLEKALERMVSGFDQHSADMVFPLQVLKLWMFSHQTSRHTILEISRKVTNVSEHKMKLLRNTNLTLRFRLVGWRIVNALKQIRDCNLQVHLGRELPLSSMDYQQNLLPFKHNSLSLRLWGVYLYCILVYSFVEYSFL